MARVVGWLVVSVAHGAIFNVWMINLFPLVLVGGLLWRLHAGLNAKAPSSARPLPRGWRGLYLCSVAFVGVGFAIAFGLSRPLFGVYTALFSETYFGGSMPPQALAYMAFIAGPIGGTIAAPFLMLAWAARAVGTQRPLWLLRCFVGSLAVWFVLDSTMSAVHGAWFNIAIVNLPTVLVMAVALLAAGGRIEHPRATKAR